MLFKKQITNVDYGTTSIENIFINEFMPMANGTFVKVYLMGYKYATEDSTHVKMSNAKLAKHLNLSIEDVHNAWDFWEQKGIIKKQTSETSDEYGVEFLSLRQLYVEHNFELKKAEPAKKKKGYTSSSNDLIEALKVPGVKKMFHEIENIMRRPLVPNESREVLDWIFNYKMDPDMIITAFDYSVHKRNVRSVKYVASIMRAWYDSGIITMDQLETHFKSQTDRYMHYKKIYKILGYGSKSVSAGDKEVINSWFDQLQLSMDYLERVLTESSKKTSNVNMNYMNSIIKGLYEDNVRDLESFESYLKKQHDKKPPAKSTPGRKSANRFQNFKGNLTDVENKDLKEMMLRKAKNRKSR